MFQRHIAFYPYLEEDALLICDDLCRSPLQKWGVGRSLFRTPDHRFFVVRVSLWNFENHHDVFEVSLEDAVWLYHGPLCNHRVDHKTAFYRGEEFPSCDCSVGDGEASFPSGDPHGFEGEEGILLASDRCRGGDLCWGMYRTLYRTPSGKFFIARTSLWPGEKKENHDIFEVSLADALWLYHGALCWHAVSEREAFYTGEEFPPCDEDDGLELDNFPTFEWE